MDKNKKVVSLEEFRILKEKEQEKEVNYILKEIEKQNYFDGDSHKEYFIKKDNDDLNYINKERSINRNLIKEPVSLTGMISLLLMIGLFLFISIYMLAKLI